MAFPESVMCFLLVLVFRREQECVVGSWPQGSRVMSEVPVSSSLLLLYKAQLRLLLPFLRLIDMAAILTITTAPSNKPTVGSFKYLGCRTDSRESRALTGAYTHGPDVDLESCASYCSSFEYFGTEFGQECFCSNTLATTSATANEDDCNMACAGNAQELCGAGDRLSAYKVGVPVRRSHWKVAK